MIVTVTLNPAIDHTVQLDRLPAAGEIARTDDATVQAGGKGINVSKYLAKLETETLATGIVGGAFGEFVESELTDDGIDHEFVHVGANTRLNTTILADDGEYKINQNGPAVDPGIVEDLIATIEAHEPDVVVVAGSSPRGIDPDHIDRIAQAGAWETAVDVAGPTLRALDADYALCKPNESELAAATGMATDTVAGSKAAARALREQGFDRVVASLGPQGAIMATADAVLHAPALDVDVVDTVGAGDSLLAGVLAELVRGSPDAVALRSGLVVAARVVGVPGTEIPDLDDVHADLQRVSVSTE